MKVTDQLNRTIEIPDSCKRIVSLVPSQTELLVDLGLEDRLVGVTKFCIHPKGLKQAKIVIGGTKNFNFDKIKALNPDLIIGNKEENYKEGIEELAKDYPVWMSDIFTIDDAQNMISSIGEITNTKQQADELNKLISVEISTLNSKISKPKKALYFIWKNPYMVAGSNNYINEMLRLDGYQNLCNSKEFSRYPELTENQIKEIAPEEILLSSEPFPFKEKHIAEIQQLAPNAVIKIVDGELYSWYGSRLLKALRDFNSTK
jgi:ABC-type Fe3+-hydroxamate transport system substrate-binding protein